MLTPALSALESMGLSPVVYIGNSDSRFDAIKDISPWPVFRASEIDHFDGRAFQIWGDYRQHEPLPAFTDIRKQDIPAWEKIHEARACLDLVGIKRKDSFPTRIRTKHRLKLHTGKKEKLIAFGNGSVHSRGMKKWPNESWVSLAGKLIDDGCQIIFLGSANEGKSTGAALQKAYGPRKVWNLAGEISLAEAADVLTQCAAFVATDSALMHVADAVGTKCYCLWGPTLWTKNRPWNGNGIQISAGVECAPCFGTEKYFSCDDQKCMKAITPGMAYEAMLDL